MPNAIGKAVIWHVSVALMAQQIPKCHANSIKSLGSLTFFANLEKENLPNVLENSQQDGMKHVHWAGTMDSLIIVSTKL